MNFNWIPNTEIQQVARKQLEKNNIKNNELAELPMLKREDIGTYILPKEILNSIENNIQILSMIEPRNFLKGATNE